MPAQAGMPPRTTYSWLALQPRIVNPLPSPDTFRLSPLPKVDVGEHNVSGGGCGCGSSHGGDAVAVASPEQTAGGTTRPAFLGTSTSASLDTPSTFKPQPETKMEFLKKIDWENDWWKFAAGALAYKLLAK